MLLETNPTLLHNKKAHIPGGSVAQRLRSDTQVIAELLGTAENNRLYLHGSVKLWVQVTHLSSQIAVFGDWYLEWHRKQFLLLLFVFLLFCFLLLVSFFLLGTTVNCLLHHCTMNFYFYWSLKKESTCWILTRKDKKKLLFGNINNKHMWLISTQCNALADLSAVTPEWSRRVHQTANQVALDHLPFRILGLANTHFITMAL